MWVLLLSTFSITGYTLGCYHFLAAIPSDQFESTFYCARFLCKGKLKGHQTNGAIQSVVRCLKIHFQADFRVEADSDTVNRKLIEDKCIKHLPTNYFTSTAQGMSVPCWLNQSTTSACCEKNDLVCITCKSCQLACSSPNCINSTEQTANYITGAKHVLFY